MKKLGLSLLATALLAACATADKPAQQPQQPTQPVAVTKPAEKPAETAPVTPVAPVVAAPGQYNPLTDPNNVLSQREVYFDFDKYDVKEEATEVVQAHSNYLTLTTGAKTSLQGHADERGTSEYNLALGQKRADAVKKVMMTAYGVEAPQVETISYGKERPAVDGHDEAAWAKNRRVEIVYPGEAKFPKK